MKKCVHIFLISLFLFNSFGVVVLFLKLQEDIKEEVIKQLAGVIPEKDLIKITFFKTDKINWEEENEFEFQGTMYDVVRQEDKGNYVVYYCFSDQKETNLIKSFKKQFDEERTKRLNSGKTNLINFNFTAIPGQSFKLNSRSNLYEHINIKSVFYKSVKMEVNSPPPKCS